MKGAARRIRSSDAAVSDVVGSMLLVGITVVVMAGVAVVILSIDGPQDEQRADLDIQASPGLAGWGTGDESILLTHQGGEALTSSSIDVVLLVNQVPTYFSGATLGVPWDDGTFSIGESWLHQFLIDMDDRIEVMVVQAGTDGRVMASGVLRAGGGLDCSSDVTPPTVQTWIVAPADINAGTNGPASVTAMLRDDCSGPSDTDIPHLQYRLDGGAWTDTGAMSLASPGKWTGSIPDLGWSTLSGQLLEMRVAGMVDLAGNAADSTPRADNIQPQLSVSYLTGIVVASGSVDDTETLADNDGDYATFSQVLAGGPMYGSATENNGVGSAPNAAGAPDDLWAGLADNGDRVITKTFDTAGQTGTITGVEIHYEGNYLIPPDNDHLRLSYRTQGGSWRTIDDNIQLAARGAPPATPADQELAYDVTSDQGSWSWSDIQTLEIRVEYQKSGGTDAVTFYIDAMWVVVSTPGTPGVLDATASFDPLPVGSAGLLEIGYQVIADTYHVEVWDGAAWNSRGPMTSTAPELFTYVLTAAERDLPGGPEIRIQDNTPGTANGSIRIDFIRVVN